METDTLVGGGGSESGKKIASVLPGDRSGNRVVYLNKPLNHTRDVVHLTLKSPPGFLPPTMVLSTSHPHYFASAELNTMVRLMGDKILPLCKVGHSDTNAVTYKVTVEREDGGPFTKIIIQCGRAESILRTIVSKPFYIVLLDCPPTVDVTAENVPAPPNAKPLAANQTLPSDAGSLPTTVLPVSECVVCCERPVNRVCVPCGHATICGECVQKAEAEGCNPVCMICKRSAARYRILNASQATKSCQKCGSSLERVAGEAEGTCAEKSMSVSCGHVSACHGCVAELNHQVKKGLGQPKCPICSKNAARFVKLFF